MVKKRGFWKNACLKQSNTLPMLTYLNRMSAKGLHAVGMSRFKNEFDQNKNVRYVYAVCNVHSEDYYREVGRWERVFEYKSLAFYRKKLPKDHVSIKKRGLSKKAMKEKLWLIQQLDKGLLLFGKAEDEYIFERLTETGKTEYFVDYIQSNKNPDEYLYEKALDGFECPSPSTDGTTYYFIKTEGKEVVRGLKKLRSDAHMAKKRMRFSFVCTCIIAAISVTSLIFALRYSLFVIPCLIAGNALTVSSLIIFLIFRYLYVREKKRIRDGEESIEAMNGKVADAEDETEDTDTSDTVFNESADTDGEPMGANSTALLLGKVNEDEWQYVDDDDGCDPFSDDQMPPNENGDGVTYAPIYPTHGQNGDGSHIEPPIPSPTPAFTQDNGEVIENGETDAFGTDTLNTDTHEKTGNVPSKADKKKESKRKRILLYQLFSGIFLALVYVSAVISVLTLYTVSLGQGQNGKLPLLAIGIILSAFLPAVIYYAVASSRFTIRELKKSKNKDF